MSIRSAVPARPRSATEVAERTDVRHAPQYRVLVHNDDVTTMEFVIEVLRTAFRKNQEDATQIMLVAHRSNVALVDVLPLEQAEFRVEQAHSLARTRKYPLKFTYEPVE